MDARSEVRATSQTLERAFADSDGPSSGLEGQGCLLIGSCTAYGIILEPVRRVRRCKSACGLHV